MNQATATSSNTIWQLTAVIYRAARSPYHVQPDSRSETELCELLGVVQERGWKLKLRTLIDEIARQPQGSLPRFGDFTVGDDSDRQFVLDALRCAALSWLGCETAGQRFDEAVEKRVAETMYNFAYGLSHEINNPLANISARAQQLRAVCSDTNERQSLQVIIEQSTRAHEMLAEMMLAVQQPQIQLSLQDARLIAERCVVSFSEQAEQARMVFDYEISDSQLPVRLDATALQEALQAIFQNSLQASEPGATISFRCVRCDASLAEAVQCPDLEPEVVFAITDNGCGISAAGIQQAFDLYYCGREAGRSLGIGLCKARRIVEAHGGSVKLSSQLGVGTTFEIRLPWCRFEK